jgi:hypothetical protein
MTAEEIQSAIPDQFSTRAYGLNRKGDNIPFHPRTIFLTYKVLSLPAFIHVEDKEIRFAHNFLIPCGAADARSLGTLNIGVLLTLHAGIAVRVGMTESHVPTHYAV